MSEDSAKKMKQGAGKRLNDKQRVEIIQIAENNKVSKRQLADKYGVSEAAIRKLLLKKDEFLKRYYDTPEEIRDQRLRGKNIRLSHDLESLHGTAGLAGGVAVGGVDGTLSTDFARTTGSFHSYSSKSLYPPDDPWKHGLNGMAAKVAPFLKNFVQGKVMNNGANLATAAVSSSPVLPGGLDGTDVSLPPPAPTDGEPANAADWIGFSRMLRDIRRAFHRYPETGFQEVRTQAFIKKFCETSLRIPGKNIRVMASTGLVIDVCHENATINLNTKRKLPVLAFRADMDALQIEELNDHLPYCSTQKKQRKELRKRKKRKSMPISGNQKIEGKGDESVAITTGGNGGDVNSAAASDSVVLNDADVDVDMVAPGTPPSLSAGIDTSVTEGAGDDFDVSDAAGAASIPSVAAHMCGHDGHMVMVLGLCAMVVRNAHLLPPETFVRFIFQPAEEGPGGAEKMIEDGALKDVDEVYGLHNYPFPLYSVHIKPGAVMAHEVEFAIDITGIGGHGSAPQNCVDPILAGATIVQSLQSIVSRSLSPTETAVVSVTKFHGGDTNNVIPSRVALAGTIRDFDLELAEKIKSRMEAIVHSTCAAFGATGQVHFTNGYPPTINPYEETRNVQQIAMDIGLYVSEQGLPLMAAEDFSYYLQERKGCFFFLGTKEEGDDEKTRMLHTNQYDFNDKAIPLGIRLFLGVLQSRIGCELYSVEELQAFQVAMERIALSVVTIV